MRGFTKKDMEALRASGAFDAKWYLETYPDVKALGMDPLEHYLWIGKRLGRQPALNMRSPRALTDFNAAPSSAAESGVDIIIPVFNALDDVKRCLYSVISTINKNCRVIIINDGSDRFTKDWLQRFVACHRSVSLINNEKNLGYTRSINIGMHLSCADSVVILNSDTIVTPNWIERLLACAYSSPSIGIVGPLSNAASWQSVPQLFDGQSFAVNNLPDGAGPSQMAQIVSDYSAKIYPRVSVINGFCFFIKRSVINTIGYFDEEFFPVGYGEENDYCIRAAAAGFELAVADDCYVFHAKSRSFGHGARRKLSAEASEKLRKKYSAIVMERLVDVVRNSPELKTVRALVSEALQKGRRVLDSINPFDLSVLFLLPARGEGGGAHSVVQEVYQLRQMGVRAAIAVPEAFIYDIRNAYTDLNDAAEMFICCNNEDINYLAITFDVVVATLYTTASVVADIANKNDFILPAYYVQDYEPFFFPNESPRREEAERSYTLMRDCLLFAKTRWIIDTVKLRHDVHVHKVEPSIDTSVYRPNRRAYDGRVSVSAMVRPDGRRGAARTVRVLCRLAEALGSKVDIHVFGCTTEQLSSLVSEGFPGVNHGCLTRPQVASVLQRSDIFVDLSDYQAFGRTALEAMACGSTAIVPKAGGVTEYAVDGVNCLIVDTSNEDECAEILIDLASSPEKLVRLKMGALETASRYSAQRAALSELKLFAGSLKEYRRRALENRPPRLYIVADRRGDLMPTGSAYVRVILPYTASVLGGVRVAICEPGGLPSARPNSVACIQRRAMGFSLGELQGWYRSWQKAGGKLIFEIDDDLFDAQGLVQRGFIGDLDDIHRKICWLAEAADLVTVSTKPLLDKMRPFNSNILLVPNFIDQDLWKLADLRNHGDGPYKRSPDVVTIGYVGTPTHGQDLEIIADAIRQIEAKYGQSVRVEIIGAFEKSEPLFGARVPLPRDTEYPQFVRWLLKRVHWDIGLIPLADDEFNRSKSHLKFLECGALDMAMIVSDCVSYSAVARHNENALVVRNNTEEWLCAIERLIHDPALRAKLATAARNEVREKYTIQANAQLYREVVTRALGAGLSAL